MAEIILLRFGDQACGKIAAGLTNRGHDVVQAEDLNELYDVLGRRRTALVAFNFQPEEKWPYLTAQKIRQTSGISFTKLLAVTPKINMGQVEKVFSCGIDECLSKPFRMGDLLDKIDEMLSAACAASQDKKSTAPAVAPEREAHLPPALVDAFDTVAQKGRRLGDIVEITSGIAAHDPRAKRVTYPGPDWTTTISDAAVCQFFLGEDREFYLLRKDLMRRLPKTSDYDVPEKIILKRTVLPISAVVDSSRLPFASELYGLQTVKGLACGYLCCVLNSRYSQFFFNRYRPPADGLRGVYLSRKDLETLPVIIPDMGQQMDLVEINHRLAAINPKTKTPARVLERSKMLAEMNRSIFNLFGFSETAVKELTDLHF